MQSKHSSFSFLAVKQIAPYARQTLIKLMALGLLTLSVKACSTNYVHEYIEKEGGKSGNWMQVNDSKEVKIVANQVDGPIVMNDAETEVLAFPAGASVFVSIKADDYIEMQAKREGDSALQIVYKVNAQERTREQMTDAQLKQLWQHFFRRSGLSLENRSARITKNEGIDGLLTEITQLGSNNVTRRYLSHLIEQYDINDKQFDKLTQIAAGISSNSEKSRAYKSILQGKKRLSESQLLALIEGMASISSDSNLASFLQALTEKVNDQDSLAAIIKTARDNIASDSTLSKLYEEVNEKSLNDDNRRLLIEAGAQAIGSDSQLARLYEEINERGLTQSTTRVLIQSASSSIGSSTHLSRLLVEIAEADHFTDALVDDMLSASQQISSSSRREALLAVLVTLK